jgi:crotonobetainyl-CoA:carnitine CoA-transferase CaiB-like acyl-CoA transferase
MLSLLDGVRVLDLTILSASFATSMLADVGADVIKVEELPGGDYLRQLDPIVDEVGVGSTFLAWNRNKKGIALNLGIDQGKQIFLELLQTADVVVESARPGVRERQGIDYASLAKIKPDLVYCSLSGFGQTGPYRNLPSHGFNIDGAAGMFRMSGAHGGRPEIRVSTALGTMERGPLYAAYAIVAALLKRERTGRGQYLDVSMWDAAVAFNEKLIMSLNPATGDRFESFGEGGLGPRYNVYGTRDDKVIFVAPIEKKFWMNFCRAVERLDWIDRGEWSSAMDFGRDDAGLRDDIEQVMRTRTRDEWLEAFAAFNVPATPVAEVEELESDPQVQARGMFVTGDKIGLPSIKFIRPPMLVPGSEYEVSLAPPTLGEHTKEILAEIGYDDTRCRELEELGAVVAAHDSPPVTDR